jgi:hypothetical protein
MRDLPTGPALLALARDVLLNDLLPLLPPDAHLDARLVANGMVIAEREAIAGDEAGRTIMRELRRVYGEAALTHPALRAGSPLSRNAGKDAEWSEAGEGLQDLLRRFAQDLRVGAFEACEPLRREACDVLWQLTIAKLRLANPRFLTANGFR